VARHDITDQSERPDKRQPTERNEPTDSTEPADPTLPIDSTEPTDPMESTEWRDPMERTEFWDLSDQRDPSIRTFMALSIYPYRGLAWGAAWAMSSRRMYSRTSARVLWPVCAAMPRSANPDRAAMRTRPRRSEPTP
jgi:hypothetical protein